MKEVITTCALDCPDNCAMLATVEKGRLTRLRGNPGQAYTDGYLCPKGYRYPDTVYRTDRVLYPHKKVGPVWQRITWEDALLTIGENLKFFKERYGNRSIMYYQGAPCGGARHMLKRLFSLFGGMTAQSDSICSDSVTAAQRADMGRTAGNDPEDLLRSKLIILWGKDPYTTGIHLVPILREARARGAEIILIDPAGTRSRAIARKHLAPRPGSDGYLAIGIALELIRSRLMDEDYINRYSVGFEGFLDLLRPFSMADVAAKCDMEADVIRDLARSYGSIKPASILLGRGLNKQVQGPETVRLIDALGAMTGNIGLAGGGVTYGFDSERYVDPGLFIPGAGGSHQTIPEALLADVILESKGPPVKTLWINRSDPFLSRADSGTMTDAIEKLDFIVVVDDFMTDTGKLADIFLPATTFLEEEDIIVGRGHNWVGPVTQVIEPLGEARSDLAIAQGLAGVLGLEEEMKGSSREWLGRIFSPMEREGLAVERVLAGPVRCPVAPSVAFENRVFMTGSGKFEFVDRSWIADNTVETPTDGT